MENFITVRHSANIGDLIASLAGLKGYWEETGQRFVYMQELNVDAVYHQNYYHPTQEGGKQVMCNRKMFDMIKPLIEAQPYIERFEEFEGQKVIVDLNAIRGGIEVNIPFGAIQSWYMLAFPDLAYDISKPWINVDCKDFPSQMERKILVNFTNRYRNQFIHYYFLKDYQEELIFIGTEKERDEFCEKWNLNISLLSVNNFLELAQIMEQSKFLLSNQSFCWNLNRALNMPSILEMYPSAPNCIPFVGNENYGFYHQKGLEYYFNTLINKYK
jgi:hypothetical protein